MRIFGVLSLFLLAAGLAIAAGGPDMSKVTGRTAAEQAAQVANQYWDTQFRKCGEFSFSQSYGAFRAVKGIRYVLNAQSLSEADRLNGVEWRGTTTVTADAARDFNPNLKGWAPWGRWLYDMTLQLMKKNGQWNLIPPQGFAVTIDWSTRNLPNCNQIPDFSLDATKSPLYMPPPGVH